MLAQEQRRAINASHLEALRCEDVCDTSVPARGIKDRPTGREADDVNDLNDLSAVSFVRQHRLVEPQVVLIERAVRIEGLHDAPRYARRAADLS